MMKIRMFILFLLLIKCSPYLSRRCGIDLIDDKPHEVIGKNENDNNRRGLSNEFKPLQIKIDYTYLKYQNYLSSANLNNLMNIFTEVTKYLSSLLSTMRYNIKISRSNIMDYCDIPQVELNIENSYNTYDLLIFPMIKEDLDELILAQASTCIIISGINKPIGGIVQINPNFSLLKLDSDYYMKYLLIHEISHVLGFSKNYFKKLNLTYTEEVNGINITYINSPKVLQKARQHFNCPNLKGIQLENQGGKGSVGSHWEARYMLGDYMISTDYSEIVISDITLAFFEDTGFYKVNYYTGGLFRFGKNMGCTFLEEECVSNDGQFTLFPNEFCTKPEAYFCGSSHLSRGDCYVYQYEEEIEPEFRHYSNIYMGGFSPVDYCPVSFPFANELLDLLYNYPKNCNYGSLIYKEIGEDVGKNSVCFESSLIPKSYNITSNESYSICYKIECDKKGKQIKVHIGESVIICPKNGSIIENPDGFVGEIKCPDYNLVCTSETWCNEMFDCIDKKSLADPDTFIFKISQNNGFNEAGNKEDYSLHLEFKIFIYLIEIIVFLL